ncbi:MAG TPA: preQ(1) synthase [Candidatus Omnitrophota bacterium]|nr:preQ(1) synthase [Candidatus Omnitrophota bacterium]
MPKHQSSYEGLQENINSLILPDMEVFSNKYPHKDYAVHLNTSEFTCICPKTGLPDFAIINLTYGPHKLCIELKSFKLYLVAYRNVGIFHEHLTNKILEDFVKACQPRWAKIEVVMNPRGGIGTTVTAEYKRRKR